MKKYFIADALTALKIVPAVCILIFCQKIDSGIAFLLFGAGELLDALDGMAAKKWPHPPETEKFWFRKNIKLIESGLDLLLAIAALIFIMIRIDLAVGILILIGGAIVGLVVELWLYGKLFGTPKTARGNSLFRTNPAKARAVVGCRLLAYLACLTAIIMILVWNAPWSLAAKIAVVVFCALVSFLIVVKKLRDGRLDDVLKFFGK